MSKIRRFSGHKVRRLVHKFQSSFSDSIGFPTIQVAPLSLRPREPALAAFCREQPAECLFSVAADAAFFRDRNRMQVRTSSDHSFPSLSLSVSQLAASVAPAACDICRNPSRLIPREATSSNRMDRTRVRVFPVYREGTPNTSQISPDQRSANHARASIGNSD